MCAESRDVHAAHSEQDVILESLFLKNQKNRDSRQQRNE